MAKIIELIKTFSKEGEGTKDSPVRQVVLLYTKKGDLVAKFDPCDETEQKMYDNWSE